MLRAACQQYVAWIQDGLPQIPVAVNISMIQFRRSDFVDIIKDIIEEYKIEPSSIELEITESMIMENVEEMMAILHQLHAIGVKLAVDDFGTGHSSLAYLKRFEVDTLKIDRSFVSHVNDDQDDAIIAKAIISLAKSLNLRIAAEGVETEDQLGFLREHGCDEAQGYLFTVPLKANEFAAWYWKNSKRIAAANSV